MISIKEILSHHFDDNGKLFVGDMYFRLYNPLVDKIVEKYSSEDWNNILKDYIEEDLKDLSTCANVVILLWCNADTDDACGMIYFEENIACRREVSFHGGTWNHNPRYFRSIFKSIIKIFDIVLANDKELTTTCGRNNPHADKFQNSLCFEVKNTTETYVLKNLNKVEYSTSTFIHSVR